jgi:GTP cyclohydrolase I
MITHPTLSLLPAAPAPAAPAVDRPRLERAVREMLLAIGEDPTREGLVDTPARVARAWQELFSGLGEQAGVHLARTFVQESEDLVTLSDIEFTSFCEHHLLPVFGRAHIAYLPSRRRVVGLSKLARTVEVFARRPQLQERMTAQIADALMEHLEPEGALVVIEAEHMCMKMRGVRKQQPVMKTLAARGRMRDDDGLRQETLLLLLGGEASAGPAPAERPAGLPAA